MCVRHSPVEACAMRAVKQNENLSIPNDNVMYCVLPPLAAPAELEVGDTLCTL